MSFQLLGATTSTLIHIDHIDLVDRGNMPVFVAIFLSLFFHVCSSVAS